MGRTNDFASFMSNVMEGPDLKRKRDNQDEIPKPYMRDSGDEDRKRGGAATGANAVGVKKAKMEML
jgi:hypothetical protein